MLPDVRARAATARVDRWDKLLTPQSEDYDGFVRLLGRYSRSMRYGIGVYIAPCLWLEMHLSVPATSLQACNPLLCLARYLSYASNDNISRILEGIDDKRHQLLINLIRDLQGLHNDTISI